MNNTFSFERFGKVLAMDFKNYIRNYGISLVVLCSVPIAVWLISLIFGAEFGPIGRRISLGVIVTIATIMAPSRVYGKANLQREGVAFAMLPASALEKFLSMLLFCAILTPIVCMAGAWAIDSLLAMLPFGGFDAYVDVFGIGKLCQKISVEEFTFFTPFKLWYSLILGMLFWSVLFMLGNMIFKKFKVVKTVACYLGVSYVIGTIFSFIMLRSDIVDLLKDGADEYRIVSLMNTIYNSGLVVNTVLLLVLLYFVYRKIKTQNY